MTQGHHRQSSSLSGRSLDRIMREGDFDVDLSNMADATLVSSYDDQSKWVGSSAMSLPPDVHEERKQTLKQLEQQRKQQEQPLQSSTEPRHSPSDCESQISDVPSSPKDELKKAAKRFDPLKHYSLAVLSNIFFLIGSGLFIAASFLEYHEHSNNRRSSTFLTSDNSLDLDEDPRGYHLKISTSIDTHVTQQMICMLGATFCFLQVGFINVVRTPWDKFHFFQILAGLFGSVSAMFWETKTILSDISYFFFVHAMTGQALSLLHSHWRRLVAPIMAELRSEERPSVIPRARQRPGPQRRFTISPLKQQKGHFAFDSSQCLYENRNPSGLMSADAEEDIHYPADERSSSDGGFSFSVENSFSLEELSVQDEHSEQRRQEVDNLELPPPTDDPSDEDLESEKTSIRRNAESVAEEEENEREELVLLKFGFLFCFADSIFVLGSLVETAQTYLTILVLPTQGGGEDKKEWDKVARGFNLVPGVLWLLCALVSLMATLWLRRHQRHQQARLRRFSI